MTLAQTEPESIVSDEKAAPSPDAETPYNTEPATGTEPAEAVTPDADAPGETPAEATVSPSPPAGGDTVILRDRSRLPDVVRATWQELVDAARSGDIDKLRPIIDAQPQPPTFAFAQVDEPIEYLKSLSGDPAGREILAILLEILETGYVHVDAGTEQEMFLWPYFARYPLSRLTPQETVEMFTILTAGDYQDMLSYGAYIFFRVGIGADGAWHFFVAGD